MFKLKRALQIAVLTALCIALPVSQYSQGVNSSKFKTTAELEQALAHAAQIAQSSPHDIAAQDEYARLLLLDGQQELAEKILTATLKQEPLRISTLLMQAQLARKQFKFSACQATLALIPAAMSQLAEVRLLHAALLQDAMDFDKAAAIYRDLAADVKYAAAAWCGLAEIAYWQNKYGDADAACQKCLAADPHWSRAYLLQSLMHRMRQENDKWAAQGRKAVDVNPFDDEARANLFNIIMRGEQKMTPGYEQAKIALRLNPYCWSAHNYIGNGWTMMAYGDEKIPGDAATVARMQTLLKTGDNALLQHALDKADEAFQAALSLYPQSITALIGRGAAAYQGHHYESALGWFQKALTVNPDYGLAHYGMAQSLLRLKDAINARLAEIETRFAALTASEPPCMRAVFINFAQQDAEMQKILCLAVQPLRMFLPLAKTKHATFFITPFHWLQSQAPGMADIKGQRTFDLRLWDDVKGMGGRNALSGEDWERDVKRLRFNVVAHEFTHQVHAIMDKELCDKIEALYQKAKRERRTLDFYSDANVFEYFAVGVEAYVSAEKLADQKITYGHTRQELKERDPDLYAFIAAFDAQNAPAE